MNLLFTQQELREIFNPTKPAGLRHPPLPAKQQLRKPSTTNEGLKRGTKPTASANPGKGRTQRSPQAKSPQPLNTARRIRARKHSLSATTSTHCEHVRYNPQSTIQPTWKVVPIDLPHFRKRAHVIAQFYHAKNTNQFAEYIPNLVEPQRRDIEAGEELSESNLGKVIGQIPEALENTSWDRAPKNVAKTDDLVKLVRDEKNLLYSVPFTTV
ncbi:hypothetical protein GE061_011363 [Apolygus lucorum]|uniref:Uncharacterized protein n=1 Tax=Apolygus lucorum TaxID=248454 RepID=A0A8S9XX36_APOLU|nr:hypothetical protein GE061_011363 [Apolygus lucorum]